MYFTKNNNEEACPRIMLQGFHSDDGSFFHGERRDTIINNGSVHAAAGSLVEKHETSDDPIERILHDDDPFQIIFPGDDIERIFQDDSIETGHSRQSNFYKKIQKIPPLNLKLENWQTLTAEIETLLSEQSTQMNQKPKRADFVSQHMTEKMKASNFPALVLKIGSWERVTKHEGDLVAKFYYAKKKLVWEFLEMTLKRKIEIQWADILGIRATIEENEPGILELELKQPPTFHHEIDPQPRKHTHWRVIEDFTEGQALMCRRHYLKFPPGVLDRHLERLLQCDNRLFELSQKPFPTLDTPNFQQTRGCGISEFSLNLSGHRPQMYHGLHFSQSHMNNTSLFPAQQVQSYQPTMQMQPPFSIKDLSSPVSDNSGITFWGQAANYFPANQIEGHFTIASTTPPVDSYQNCNYIETGSMGGNLYDQMLLDRVKNNLMTDSRMEYYGIPRMASYEALINQANFGQDMKLSANDHSNDTAGRVAWMLPPGSENPWLPAQATQEMPLSMSQMRDNFAITMETTNIHEVELEVLPECKYFSQRNS